MEIIVLVLKGVVHVAFWVLFIAKLIMNVKIGMHLNDLDGAEKKVLASCPELS